MSEFETLSADAEAFRQESLSETVYVTPKGTSTPIATRAIVFRDPLQTRITDHNQRVEESMEVQIEFARYPAADGTFPGVPNLGGDSVELLVRLGDTTRTKKRVSALVSQAGGAWHLKLD